MSQASSASDDHVDKTVKFLQQFVVPGKAELFQLLHLSLDTKQTCDVIADVLTGSTHLLRCNTITSATDCERIWLSYVDEIGEKENGFSYKHTNASKSIWRKAGMGPIDKDGNLLFWCVFADFDCTSSAPKFTVFICQGFVASSALDKIIGASETAPFAAVSDTQFAE